MKNFALILSFFCLTLVHSQVGIGTSTPQSSAALDVTSTSKGFLYPRMTNTQMLAISSPATGLQVFNSDANCLYYFDGNQWLSALNSYKVYADYSVNVQFDNLIVRIPSSSNYSLQIRTVSGSITASGTSNNNFISTSAGTAGSVSSISGFNRQQITIGTTFSYWQSTANFLMHGSTQEIFLNDETNGRNYRILCVIGSGYFDNFFEIERLK
jgi:hypothetical protein